MNSVDEPKAMLSVIKMTSLYRSLGLHIFLQITSSIPSTLTGVPCLDCVWDKVRIPLAWIRESWGSQTDMGTCDASSMLQVIFSDRGSHR